MATVIDQLAAQRDELESKVAEFKEQMDSSSERMSQEQRDEWNRLNTELEEVNANLKERQAVEERIRTIADNGGTEQGAHFNVGPTRTKNPYDLSTVERSFSDPSVEGTEIKDRAARVLDGARVANMGVEEGKSKEHIERLQEKFDGDAGVFSRYMIATDNPAYKRAFPKLLSSSPHALTREEIAAVGQVQAATRALSLTTNSGGFAVPFTLDPTIIPTSNLAVNPFRGIARVEQIVTDDWNGVSSAGVSASWDAEGAEVSDDAPTLAQPSVSVHKAAAFVPFTLEVGMDWAGLQSEMAIAIQDAKDELEATAFATGTGSGQPQGITVGATATIAEATGGSFAAADVYALEAALPPRFRPMASFVANRAQYQRVRQFDTQGGAQLWIDNLRLGLVNGVPTPGNVGASLLGYGAYESSAMVSTATTSSGKILILGDFRYYLIADRIGLTLEYIPHLFHTSNNRPSGTRGVYAYWRTGAGVLSTNAFRVLEM